MIKACWLFFLSLHGTHTMCLFLPASAWPPLGGMRKTPHFWKSRSQRLFWFDTLIKSIFSNFWSFSFTQGFLKLKIILFKPQWNNESNSNWVLRCSSRNRMIHQAASWNTGPLAVFIWTRSANNKSSKFKASPESQTHFYFCYIKPLWLHQSDQWSTIKPQEH